MKYLYLNLKRFDVPRAMGGMSDFPIADYGAAIVRATEAPLAAYRDRASFCQFFPEAHLLSALSAKAPDGVLTVGCQGLHREDVRAGGNFGAMTSLRPAAAMRAMGCGAALIGHCEERREKRELLLSAGATPENASRAVDAALRAEAECALAQGMHVLFCVGETAEERASDWRAALRGQLARGVAGVSAAANAAANAAASAAANAGSNAGGLANAGSNAGVNPEVPAHVSAPIVIGYEPIWAIGPGKTPASAAEIAEAARFIKAETGGLPVVYGGGLKLANAAEIAAIPEVDGGLIALTRFSGTIGFYPAEYLEIVGAYLGA